ncbi:uncharacterized protein K444DRAFT_516399, partial [Hyaloscypha bicolor E]
IDSRIIKAKSFRILRKTRYLYLYKYILFFLSFYNFYRYFIKEYKRITRPLILFIKKDISFK